MTTIKPSKDFPSDSFARNIANAVMSIICENIPALKGRHLGADIVEHAVARTEDNFGEIHSGSIFAAAFMAKGSVDAAQKANLSSDAIDTFQNRLVAEIAREIREQGDEFNFLDLYIRDSHETSPQWLGQMIEEVAEETGFNLYALMPYREKIAFTIHSDGELFWGTSGYGPARATTRLEDYVGKPESSVPFANINQPNTAQAYSLDLGEYVPLIVPDDEPPETENPNHWNHRTGSINHQIKSRTQDVAREEGYLADGNDWYNEERHQYNLREKQFLESLLTMWGKQGLDGYPDYRIAFVPKHITEGLSKEDFCNIDVLRRLKKADGTTMHVVQGWQHPITFTSPYQYTCTEEFLHHPTHRKGELPIIKNALGKPIEGHWDLDSAFKQEGDCFRLLTAPFYLSEVRATIQTGVGEKNTILDKGTKLLYTIGLSHPIGTHNARDAGVYRFPEAALGHLRIVENITHPFSDDIKDMQHLYGVQLGSAPPNLSKLPAIQPNIGMPK